MKLSIIIVAIICSLISATSAKLGGNVAGGDGGRSLKSEKSVEKGKKSDKGRTLKGGDKGGEKSGEKGKKSDKGRTLKGGNKGGEKSGEKGKKSDKGI